MGCWYVMHGMGAYLGCIRMWHSTNDMTSSNTDVFTSPHFALLVSNGAAVRVL